MELSSYYLKEILMKKHDQETIELLVSIFEIPSELLESCQFAYDKYLYYINRQTIKIKAT